jgi:integrase
MKAFTVRKVRNLVSDFNTCRSSEHLDVPAQKPPGRCARNSWRELRGSDAVKFTWQEVSFESKEIERVTQKRRKKVVLPINLELLFALEAEHARRKPQPKDRILINPATNRPLTRPGLYRRILALGKRAGVQDAHPHRFRDTLAVDMLSRGASPYDVAKILSDTIETVERHYAPFTKELRERVRSLIDNGEGLEKTDCTNIAQSELPSKRIQ